MSTGDSMENSLLNAIHQRRKLSSVPSNPPAGMARDYYDSNDIQHILTSGGVNKYILDSVAAYLAEQSTPATPESGYLRLWATTGGELKAKNDAGVILTLGGPCMLVSATGNQTVSAGVLTKSTWDTEEIDTDGWMDIATNYRYTPLIPGKYMAFAQAEFNGAASNTSQLHIYKNGVSAAFARATISSGTTITLMVGKLFDMNGSTDYLEAFLASQTTTVNKSTYRGLFGAVKVG